MSKNEKQRAVMSVATHLLFWGTLGLSAAFMVGAVMLGIRFARLPASSGELIKAQVVGAILFAFGFALGLGGTGVALTASTRQRRLLGTATVLFGCAHLVLGVIVRRCMEALATGSKASYSAFILPLLLWGYSVMLAVRVPSMSLSEPERKSEPSEEQPQRLSQP